MTELRQDRRHGSKEDDCVSLRHSCKEGVTAFRHVRLLSRYPKVMMVMCTCQAPTRGDRLTWTFRPRLTLVPRLPTYSIFSITRRPGAYLERFLDLLAGFDQLGLQCDELLLHHPDVMLRRQQLLQTYLIAPFQAVDLQERAEGVGRGTSEERVSTRMCSSAQGKVVQGSRRLPKKHKCLISAQDGCIALAYSDT